MRTPLSRRYLLLTGGALALASSPLPAAPAYAIHVRMASSCERCDAWLDHLRSAGFLVTSEVVLGGYLVLLKEEAGLPPGLRACSTSEVEGYVIEGHVPAADIDRLLAERPDAQGLAGPGQLCGSPSLSWEDEQGAYDVYLFRADGTVDIWASHEPS